jgi:hypothetical protein
MRNAGAVVVGFIAGSVLAATVTAYATPATDATAKIDQAIALLQGAKADLAVAPTPSPSPTGTLPPSVGLSIWHHRWEGPSLRTWPSDVQARTGRIMLGLAQSAGAGTGRIEYAPANGQSIADHAADIRARHVLLGIGGGGDGGITVTTAAHADQMAASISALRVTYGFDGIDLDLEDPARWNEASLLRMVDLVRAAHGAGFIVGVTAALYGERTARWLSFMRACASRCAYLAVMLYDFPEAGDSRLTAVTVAKADAMAAGGLPATKMVFGFMPRPTATYLNATPSPVLAVAAWAAVKARYPAAGGVMLWEDKILAARGWDFARASWSVN